MSYTRVIPRDLFNEADLLKCVGKLWIALDEIGAGNHAASIDFSEDDYAAFEIEQNSASGAIFVSNIELSINGDYYRIWRPLNARTPYPLYCSDPETEEDIRVFSDDGKLSDEFNELIKA